MYKCIKVREIESALCCLPSVPGQCNELASISKGHLKKKTNKQRKKNYVGFWPLTLLQKKKKNKIREQKKTEESNIQLCYHIIFQIIRSKEKKKKDPALYTDKRG